MSICIDGDSFNIEDLQTHLPGWAVEQHETHVVLGVITAHSTREPRMYAAAAATVSEHEARTLDVQALTADPPADDPEEKAAVDAVVANHQRRIVALQSVDYMYQQHTTTRVYHIPYDIITKFEDDTIAFASRHPIVAAAQGNHTTVPIDVVDQLRLDDPTIPVTDMPFAMVGIIDGTVTCIATDLSGSNCVKHVCEERVDAITSAVRIGLHMYLIANANLVRIGQDGGSVYSADMPDGSQLHTDGTELYAIEDSALYIWNKPRFILVRDDLPIDHNAAAMWGDGNVCCVRERVVHVIPARGAAHIVSVDHMLGRRGGLNIETLYATPDGPRLLLSELIAQEAHKGTYATHLVEYHDGEWRRIGRATLYCGRRSLPQHVWYDAATNTTYLAGRFDATLEGGDLRNHCTIARRLPTPAITW
jgi:hypothetical protein